MNERINFLPLPLVSNSTCKLQLLLSAVVQVITTGVIVVANFLHVLSRGGGGGVQFLKHCSDSYQSVYDLLFTVNTIRTAASNSAHLSRRHLWLKQKCINVNLEYYEVLSLFKSRFLDSVTR